jgi:drug/metabolite transporter (DMT)-like permease
VASISFLIFPFESFLRQQSAFFNALAVIVVPLLDALLKKKGLGWTGVASILMAVGGVALLEIGPASSSAAVVASDVSSSSLSATDTTSWIHVGDLLCLSQAVFFGVGYWRLESASTKYPKESGPITAGQLLAIAAGSVAYWTATLGGSLPSWDQIARWLGDPFIASAVAWTGLISTALALWLETVALSVVSAAELTILMTSISLWGSLFAYLTIGEVMSSFGMLGGALILSGCVLTSLGKEEVAPKTPGSE